MVVPFNELPLVLFPVFERWWLHLRQVPCCLLANLNDFVLIILGYDKKNITWYRLAHSGHCKAHILEGSVFFYLAKDIRIRLTFCWLDKGAGAETSAPLFSLLLLLRTLLFFVFLFFSSLSLPFNIQDLLFLQLNLTRLSLSLSLLVPNGSVLSFS